MQGTASTARETDETEMGARMARLPDRGVVRLEGPDAATLLHGLVTQDLGLLDTQASIYAGLLTPQGKILFDFFIVRTGNGLLLDVARDKAGDLIKRLTLYRLRAKVTFAEASDLVVQALWGGGVPDAPSGGVVFVDPRLPALGWRAIVPAAVADTWTSAPVLDVSAWHAHRVALGVPEGGRDFTYGDAFPHEADMDQLAGVSFSKGCYVGQEVVSRMQHRGTARKRFVQVKSDAALATGAAIMAGVANIGSIASVAGGEGLALVRLDRAAEAKAKGEALKAGDAVIEIVKPAWATFDLTPPAREASHDL